MIHFGNQNVMLIKGIVWGDKMTKDLPHGRFVYIDCDILYPDFKRSITLETIVRKLPAIENLIHAKIVKRQMRASSSGNAHILLEFDRILTVFEILQIRAWLHDDIHRLMLDLVRYLRTHDPKQTNRLWQGKYQMVDARLELSHSGPWEPLQHTPVRRLS